MDDGLRDAIRENPADRDPRLALAERWGESPEGDLVRLLLEQPSPRHLEAIRDWFERHAGWPGWATDDGNTHGGFILDRQWIGGAFDPGRWPDPARWRAGVLAVVRHVPPVASVGLPANDPHRAKLEEIETRLAGSDAAGVGGDREVAVEALDAARWAYALVDSTPGDTSGEVAQEVGTLLQYHILGWSWLGLPPFWPEAWVRVEPGAVPHASGSHKTAESPEGCARVLLWLVYASPVIFFLSVWSNFPAPSVLGSFLGALAVMGILAIGVVIFAGVVILVALGLGGLETAIGSGERRTFGDRIMSALKIVAKIISR